MRRRSWSPATLRVEAEHGHRAAVGPAEALQDLDGGGLPGAVGAEQAEQLAAPHREGDAAQHLGGAVAPPEVADLDEVVGGRRRRPRRRRSGASMRGHGAIVRRIGRRRASAHGRYVGSPCGWGPTIPWS